MRMSFSLFILKHRFQMEDIFSATCANLTRQEFNLFRCFDGHNVLSWYSKGEKLTKFNRSLSVAQYMSQNSTNQPREFSKYTSNLDEEAWQFAVRFSSYHKVHIALENLERVHSAMLEACLNLNSAMAGMETAFELDGNDLSRYRRERSRATSNLLTFSALYASYIEVCYRIRDYAGLKKSAPYSNAIRRIIGKKSGEHNFTKDLRNFILHYHLIEPDIEVSQGKTRTVRLLLKSDYLLFSGFVWKSEAQKYIQASEKLDVMKAITTVTKDVGRVVKFHQKMAERFLPEEKFAYDVYVRERNRYRHLQKSAIDLGAAFKLPSSVSSRVLDKELTNHILQSSLSDEEMRLTLLTLADRYKNLSTITKELLSREIDEILLSRPRLPNVGSFLSGREQK